MILTSKKGVLLEEDADAVSSELVAVLEQQALVYALLCILDLALRLSTECGHKKRVGSSGNDDAPVLLDECKGGIVFPQRNVGEAQECRGEFGKFIDVAIGIITVISIY